MNELVEQIKAFFVLGGRDFSNRIRLISYHAHSKALAREVQEKMREVGRESWEMGLADSKEFPSAEKLKEFEAQLKEKRDTLEDIDQQLEQLHEQRQRHQAHYQKLLNEQIKQKQPVDDELTDLLVEIKRMKKEIKATNSEIKTLHHKIDVQNSRLENLQKNDLESSKYLHDEIISELELNKRFLSLKHENLSLLDTNIEKCTAQAEKVKKVVDQYDEQIADIRSMQREIITKDKNNISELQEMRGNVQSQIRRIKTGMTPVLEKLGGEITSRRVASKKLIEHYAVIDQLESKREELMDKQDRLRKDCSSIGFGIKAGFYGMVIVCVFLLGFLISRMF